MKHLYLLTLLAALVCGSSILRAEPHAVADTLNGYYIDHHSVPHFDGSQLVGKKIVSYQITTATVDNGKRTLRVHDIITEDYQARQLAGEPVYVLDGKQVTKDEIEGLNPLAIKNMTIIKDGSREDVKKYDGWENGVIFIETKKDGTPVFKTDNSEGPKIIIRKQP
jgi:hypothetical protein